MASKRQNRQTFKDTRKATKKDNRGKRILGATGVLGRAYDKVSANRADRKTERLGYRLNKLEIKTPGRDERRLAIAEAVSAPLAEGLGSALNSIGQGVGTKIGGAEIENFYGENVPDINTPITETPTEGGNKNIIIIVIIAILVMFGMKKKKS